MERRRELRNLALPLMVFVGQSPACSGGEDACQQQKEKRMPGQPAFSFSLVVDREKGESEPGDRFKMIDDRFV